MKSTVSPRKPRQMQALAAHRRRAGVHCPTRGARRPRDERAWHATLARLSP